MTDVPLTFGAWHLGQVLGLGGAAEVRRATHAETGQVVALKRLLPMWADRPAALGAFEAERRALGRIESPHIVRLVDSGHTRKLPWLALELVDGVSLSQLIGSKPLAVPAALAVLADLARALDACHQAGVLHGDITPGNALVDRTGNVRLIDFGLATVVGGPSRPIGAGTPAFVDPEAANELPRTTDSDLFSLALLVVRLVAGQSPLGQGDRAVLRGRAARCELDLPVVNQALQQVSAELASLLATALRLPSSIPETRCTARALITSVGTHGSAAGLATLVAQYEPVTDAIARAAEDRGERVTDPTGETVTLVGDAAKVS
ncbi:MAG: serine/threonine protein kinase [Myxococcales bacterium]|nr:serine/threonine protein kinase [Myxococcales bacterium]